MNCRFAWTQQMTYVTFTFIPVVIFAIVYLSKMKEGFEASISNITSANSNLAKTLEKSKHKVSVLEIETAKDKLFLQEVKSEINKKEAANRDLKLEIKNVEDKALNFSSKLVMVEIQLGIEKDKNEKLLQNIKEIRDAKKNSTLPNHNHSSEDLVEKVKEIKSREKELIKAKEELFESENVDKSPTDENIEIKLKIEKPENNLPEPKEIDLKSTNTTIAKKEKNGTNIEIKFKIEKESEEEQNPELKVESSINNQEHLPNSTDEGIVEKIHEIKQKQKEIKVARELIINELDEKTPPAKADDNEGLQNTIENEEIPKTASKDATKELVIDKIKEIKSKEVELKEATADLIDPASTKNASRISNRTLKNLTLSETP